MGFLYASVNYPKNVSNIILRLFKKKTVFFSEALACGENIRNSLYLYDQKIEGVKICQAKSDMFNCVISFDMNLTPNLVKSINEFYQKDKIPFAFWLPENNENESVLKESGLIYDEFNVGMRKEINRTDIPDNQLCSDFEIYICKESKQFDDFAQVIASLFDGDEREEVIQSYQSFADSQVALSDDSCMQFYVGYYKGVPVSTGSLCIEKDKCGIFDLATKQTFRQMGFASEVMKKMLTNAVSYGVHNAYLQASPEGLSIYKKLGFEKVCHISTYSNQQLLKNELSGKVVLNNFSRI